MDTENTVVREVTTSTTPTPLSNTTQEAVTTRVQGDPVEFSLFKVNQIVWYIIGLIAILIGLRFLLLFLAAGNAGFVNFIYSLSGIFVAPFFGIFGQPVFGRSVIEIASLVAIVVYIILGFVINGFIDLFSKKTV